MIIGRARISDAREAVAMSVRTNLCLGEVPSVAFARGDADVHERGVQPGHVCLRHGEGEPQRVAREGCVSAGGVPLRNRGVLVADDHLRTRDAGPAEREGHEGENEQRSRH